MGIVIPVPANCEGLAGSIEKTCPARVTDAGFGGKAMVRPEARIAEPSIWNTWPLIATEVGMAALKV